jgi:hypothetical protein
MSGDLELLGDDDLEARLKPQGPTPAARRKWLQRTLTRWGLRPMRGTRGKNARFRLQDVLKAEERGAKV